MTKQRVSSSTHTQSFRLGHHLNSFTISLATKAVRRVALLCNLSTQLRPEGEGLSLPLPTPLADHPVQNDDNNARFRANLSGDDCPPHLVRKYTKPPTKSMSLNGEHFHTWRVHHLVLWTYLLFHPLAVEGHPAEEDNSSCKWPKWRHFIDDADIQLHLMLYLYDHVLRDRNPEFLKCEIGPFSDFKRKSYLMDLKSAHSQESDFQESGEVDRFLKMGTHFQERSGSLENDLCVTWSGFWLRPRYLCSF